MWENKILQQVIMNRNNSIENASGQTCTLVLMPNLKFKSLMLSNL